jgi:hypothetical protein
MASAGGTKQYVNENSDASQDFYPQVFIDTVGEGAGTYSRVMELKAELASGSEEPKNVQLNRSPVYSFKSGEAATRGDQPLKDVTGQYKFRNMRAYCYWAVRDWLNPDNKTGAMLPPGEYAGLTDVKWQMRSDGVIELESKEDLKARIGHSPDEEDSLMQTFYPVADVPKVNTVTKKPSKLKGFF